MPRSAIDRAIYYLLPLRDHEADDRTLFQGFLRSWIDTTDLLFGIAHHPPDLTDWLFPTRSSRARRTAGVTRFSILPIRCARLPTMRPDPIHPLWVVLSTAATIEPVRAWLANIPLPVLHVSTATSLQRETSLNAFVDSTRPLSGHLRRVLRLLENHSNLGRDVRALLAQRWRRPRPVFTTINETKHLFLVPNETALTHAGYAFPDKQPLLSVSDSAYEAAIRNSAHALLKVRGNVGRVPAFRYQPPMPSLALAVPGFFEQLHNRSRERVPRVLLEARRLLRAFSKQTTYTLQGVESDDLREWLASPVAAGLLNERAEEMRLYTAALTLRAASYLTSTIRIRPPGPTLRAQLANLARSARAPNAPRRKLSLLARKIGQAVSRLTDPVAAEALQQAQTGVQIIADFPLEWLPCGELPLMLRHESCRIPATPGDLMVPLTLPPPRHFLTLDDFREILVVRSFPTNDRLRPLFEKALHSYLRTASTPPKVTIVDVATRDEFVAALNAYRGAVMVFDGHGGIGADSDHLVVGEERLDAWTLPAIARVPPIVLLSACDTAALAGSHTTTANGFLAAGARSVLGTLLPVAGVASAIMVARLVFRIAEFLPAVVAGQGRAIRWTSVVTGLLRMEYASELIRAVEKQTRQHKGWQAVGLYANERINGGDIGWYERIFQRVAENAGLSETRLRALVERELGLAECMRYVHLGNPDALVVCPTESELTALGIPIR